MRRILVIDDNDSIRRMIVRCLEKQGIGALQAASTQQAQMALGQGGIDAIILDIVLGTENGWEILRHLRESSDVPVLDDLRRAGGRRDSAGREASGRPGRAPEALHLQPAHGESFGSA